MTTSPARAALETEIMSKGIQAHFPPEVLARAEQLFRIYGECRGVGGGWVQPHTRITWCQFVVKADLMPKGEVK